MSEMGSRIRDLRLDAGLTQEQLGEMVGLQKSAIAKYENGKTENMKRSVIQKMAEVLGVSPSYLMGFEDDAPYYSNPKNPLFPLVCSCLLLVYKRWNFKALSA